MESIHAMKVGVILSVLTLVFGFGMGIAFGAFEDGMKDGLREKGMAVLQEKYNGDEAKLDGALSKSWTYYKRAHLHANGLGTSALVLILLLSMVSASVNLKKYTALALGLGALGYSVFWYVAGSMAPALGGTGAAKEALRWLAWPSSGLCVLGLLMVLFLTITGLKTKS